MSVTDGDCYRASCRYSRRNSDADAHACAANTHRASSITDEYTTH